MADAYFIGAWRAIQATSKDGSTTITPSEKDFPTITIEQDQFGYYTGYIERKKMFGRIERLNVTVSETNDPETIRVAFLNATMDELYATKNTADCFDGEWFSDNPNVDGLKTLYQKM